MSEAFPIKIVGVPREVPFPSGVAVVLSMEGRKPAALDWDDFQYHLEGMVARARLGSAMAEDEDMRATGRNSLETLRKAMGLGPQDPLPSKRRVLLDEDVKDAKGGRD